MADEALLKKVHGLGDLELAVLLCLVSREHCLISTVPEALDHLVEELQLISTNVFGLTPAVVDCSPHTTLDDFAAGLLLPSPAASSSRAGRPSAAHHRPQQQHQQARRGDSSAAASYFHARPSASPASAAAPLSSPISPSSGAPPGPHSSRIANVILAKNLDRAPRAVQTQALELLRTRRIFTRTSVQAAPRQFLLVGALAGPGPGQARVTPHLNDMFFVAHWHDPEEDGFAHLEGWEGRRRGGGGGARFEGGSPAAGGDGASATDDDDDDDDTTSTASVVRRSWMEPDEPDRPRGPVFTEGDIACLAKLGQDAQVDVDVQRYQMNIVTFLRMHRAVAGGVTPTATRHLEQLARCLAPLHRLDFVTPSLVALAARKVYPHRVRVVAPAEERSMQWGSELAAVEALLDGVGPEDVIEDVLEMVAAPV